MSESETTLNIPQLTILLVISFLAIRWIMAPRPDAPPATPAERDGRNRTRDAQAIAHTHTILQMFPHAQPRDVLWDLRRNGNNVQATTERLLSGRGLDTPPQTFEPNFTPVEQPRPVAPKKSSQPDLISRHNLTGKDMSDDAKASDGQVKWLTGKSEREEALKRRREEMILAARRKMLAKDKVATS